MNNTSDKIILTDNGLRILHYMQEHDKVWVGKELGEETEIKGIYSVLNSLIKKGLVEQSEPVDRDFTNNKGETSIKSYKTYVLTEAGKSFTD